MLSLQKINTYDMKLYKTLVLAAAAAFLAVSCNTSNQPLKTEHKLLEDSSQFARISMDIELPLANSAAAKAIRDTLLSALYQQMSYIPFESEENLYPAFSGDETDTGAALEYLKSETLKVLAEVSGRDAASRAEYIMEDSSLSREQKEAIIADYPTWEHDYSMAKIADNGPYAVFMSMNNIYNGGAHGGVTGRGAMTFDKRDGHLVKPMLLPGCTDAIQPLLVEGLIEYYKDEYMEMSREDLMEHLHIEGNTIPLPSWTPYPTDDGLVFTYQQYEIASYSDGMPSFSIPYTTIKPFLTEEAARLLGL